MRERLIVVWRVTERCNLQCPFCAYDRRLERPRNSADPAEIRRFAAVLAQWRDFTGRPVLLSWLGGEPLLWEPLTALTRHCRRELGLAISTTTNGSSLHRPEVREHLLDAYAELTVSVDGPADFHDSLRGRPGLFAGMKAGVSALAAAKRRTGRGPLLRANVVLMRHNLTGLPALGRELAEWGITEITCNELGGADRPEFYPDNRPLPAQADLLASRWETWRRELAERGVALLGGEEYLRRLALSARNVPLPVADCRPGQRFLFIDETGKISPCSFTPGAYGVPLAELTAVADLMALPERFRKARSCRRAVACEDCRSTQVFEKFTPVPDPAPARLTERARIPVSIPAPV